MEAFDGLLQLSTPLPPRPQSLTHSHQHLGPDCFRDQPLPSLCVVLSPRSCPCKEQISDLDSKQPTTTSRFTTTTSGTRFTESQYTSTHRFLMASALPTRCALLTASARLTLPIWRRFIFDGLGSLSTHSGTVEPDCKITFAILPLYTSGTNQ